MTRSRTIALVLGLLAASGLPAFVLPAGAMETTVYYHAGAWDAFSGRANNGQPFCGIGHTNPADGGAFSLRFDIGGQDVTFTAAKPTWSIPPGTQVTVVMQVGLDTPWTRQADGDLHALHWPMDRAAIKDFDAQFRRGRSMTLTFPNGNEPPWTIPLTGSTAISNAFGRCVTDLTRQANAADAAMSQSPSQPFGAGAEPHPVAPIVQGPSQPFDAGTEPHPPAPIVQAPAQPMAPR
jgi:hypothetical protein